MLRLHQFWSCSVIQQKQKDNFSKTAENGMWLFETVPLGQILVLVYFALRSALDCVQASDDWKFVSKVVDRILLYIYITVCLVGGTAVILSAPSLYDTSKPMVTGSSLAHGTSGSSAGGSGAGECAHCKVGAPDM